MGGLGGTPMRTVFFLWFLRGRVLVHSASVRFRIQIWPHTLLEVHSLLRVLAVRAEIIRRPPFIITVRAKMEAPDTWLTLEFGEWGRIIFFHLSYF